ncbi:predicted protein [Naegleria gruberi]|uniref:Predicted protein n=1 Tax=Naegleria gruberi TaxID=5762 RepID=D2UZI6_NAEGR|nr:uncharacterized protein NAEGRDRAFT_54787 [Naegleria gruberi]XP_002682695.1 uncharacterized protein NAEGRDRAFT_45484 [Naegleria gruberi]EFC35709.1 predicted protein [Naegleria gruberi]EFC49951.1 predicted protein [Naegleria gruberi]|eukprot:XP_002668453.1 predicted protein [Naegleria gruberi strain NEG-M]
MEQIYANTKDSLFCIKRFQELLKTSYIGRSIVYRNQVETTMDIGRREAEEGCLTGTLILAEEQTKGRGRRGREWSSAGKGKNLYFTIVFHVRLDNAQELIKLNLAIPLAITITLRDEGLENCGIKWPNDVWVIPNEKDSLPSKISGMLIDSVQSGETLFALAGIGINLNSSFKSTSLTQGENALPNVAISFLDATNKSVDREKFLAQLCNTLENLLAFSQKDVITLYKSHDILIGKDITISPSDKSPSYTAKAVGISKFGNLMVEMKDGTGVKEMIAEEVSIRPLE